MILEDMSLDDVRHQFAQVALYLCDQIEKYQPDLIIGLAHAGWLPVELAKCLWKKTRSRPFPPAFRTNFGREKVAFYEYWRIDHEGMDNFNGGEGPEDWLHAMEWLRKARHWQTELDIQINSVLPERKIPSRVLVVDEFIAEGSTWFLFLGLIAALYPDADSIFINTDLDGWQHYLSALWLEHFHPDILARMEQEILKEPDSKAQERKRFDLFRNISRIIPGTEDIDPASLHWKSIHSNSPCIKSLNELLPGCDWYRLIEWVSIICEESGCLALELPREELEIGKHWFPHIERLPPLLRESKSG